MTGPPRYGPPGFAQPPYPAPGYDVAPRKRRTGVIAGVVALVVVVAATVVVLSLTLGTRVLDRSAVQRDVAAQFAQHQGVKVQLRCPGTMTLTKGATYRCRGTTAAGEDVALEIRVTDAAPARYIWLEKR